MHKNSQKSADTDTLKMTDISQHIEKWQTMANMIHLKWVTWTDSFKWLTLANTDTLKMTDISQYGISKMTNIADINT